MAAQDPLVRVCAFNSALAHSGHEAVRQTFLSASLEQGRGRQECLPHIALPKEGHGKADDAQLPANFASLRRRLQKQRAASSGPFPFNKETYREQDQVDVARLRQLAQR